MVAAAKDGEIDGLIGGVGDEGEDVLMKYLYAYGTHAAPARPAAGRCRRANLTCAACCQSDGKR